MLVGAPDSVLGQVTSTAADAGPPIPWVGLTYVDLGSGEPATPALELSYAKLHPPMWRPGLVAGAVFSLRGAVYGYGGLQLPVPLPLGFVARPSVAVGLYQDGGGFDLGHALEFRSALVVERAVSERIRVSTVLFHLSNAGIGRRNPGMEAVGIGVTIVPPRG